MRLRKVKDHLGINSSQAAELAVRQIDQFHGTAFQFFESFFVLFSFYK